MWIMWGTWESSEDRKWKDAGRNGIVWSCRIVQGIRWFDQNAYPVRVVRSRGVCLRSGRGTEYDTVCNLTSAQDPETEQTG